MSAKFFAVLVFVIGAAKLCGVIFNFDAQVDHILFTEQVNYGGVEIILNRMAPNTAFSFVLVGAALILLPFKSSQKRYVVHFLAVIAAFVGLLSILGYIYNVHELTGVIKHIPMAVHTAFGFLGVSLAILFAYPDTGIMNAFSSPYAGSKTARKFLPVVIFIPVILGFLRIYTTNIGLVDAKLGTSLFAMSMIITFGIYIYNNAVSINKKDIQRIKAEEKLKENEEYLKIVLNTIGEGVIVADKNGENIIFNPAAQKMLGSEVKEYGPQSWATHYGLFYPDTVTIFPAEELPLAKALNGQNSEHVEMFIKNPQVQEGIFVSVSAKKLKTDDQNQLGAVTVFHNITDRKKTEAAIKDLYDNASAGYYSLDAEGVFINANNTTLNWLGYTRMELIGKSLVDILTPEGKAIFRKLYPVFKNTGILKDVELQYIRKDGSQFSVLINSSAVKNASGEFLYTRSTIIDITERKKLEEDLKRSNIFLDTILENIPNMIFVKDAKELRFVLFNKAGENLIGMRKSEMIGKSDHDLFTKEKADYFTATDREVLKKGLLFDIKEEIIQTGKGDRWLHTQKIPITDDKGSPLYLLGISEDITAQKQSEAKLKEYNERFLRLFYASPLAMVIRSIEDGKVIDVNEEYERLLGYKKEELVGQASVGIGMKLNKDFSDQIGKNITDKKPLKNIEATVLNSKKEIIDVLVSIETIRLGNTDCILSALLDIRDRKKIEEQLKELNKELESFSYSVSHDLRAPLRIINGYAELINGSDDTLSADTKRMLNNIVTNSKRMGQLIDDLLNFSRLGRKVSVTHTTDMNLIVKNVINEQLETLPSKYQLHIDNLPECYCDSSLIKQVWQNLISNAVKYSSKVENPVINIGSIKKDGKLVYYIKDNGVGFDMKYYDKLFGVFQRLHNLSEYEGTGVGLALVQRIIKKHNGEIWAESKPNEGTTFFFTISKST